MATKKKAPAKKAPAKKAPGKPRARKSVRREQMIEAIGKGVPPAHAARAAGYSEAYATSHVYRLIERPEVRERIAAKIKESVAHADIERREIIGTVAAISRGDLADVLPDNALLQRAKEAGVSRTIKRIKENVTTRYDKDGASETTVTCEVELHPPLDAAKTLGKWMGMEKAEGANPEDVERDRQNREWAEERLREVMREMNLSIEEAAALIREKAPTVSQWLM